MGKICQVTIKYTKWPQYYLMALLDQMAIKYTNIARYSKIYPNRNFGLKIDHLANLLSAQKLKI
jgi:hypothetical protein